MDFSNLFSIGTLLYFLAAMGGAIVHFAKQSEYKVTIPALKAWAFSESFGKSCMVLACIVSIAVAARILGVNGFLGFLLVGLLGYFADSLFKRIPEHLKFWIRKNRGG